MEERFVERGGVFVGLRNRIVVGRLVMRVGLL